MEGSSSSSSKKRKSHQVDGSPSPRSSKSARMESMDPAQLLAMNKALVIEIQEKRLKVKRLVQKCEQLYHSRGIAESSFRCIRRHWQQMVTDMKLLTANLVPSDDPLIETIVNATDLYGTIDVNRALELKMPDWYVDEVQAPTEEGEEREEGEEEEDIEFPQLEKALKDECDAAKSILTQLLGSLTTSRHETSTSIVNEKLTSELRCATMKTMALKDEIKALKRQMSEIEADSVIKEKQRHKAVRDLERYKHSSGTSGGAADLEGKSPATASAPTAAAAAPGRTDDKDKATTTAVEKGKVEELELKCQSLELKLKQEREKKNDTSALDAERKEAARVADELRAEIARVQTIADQARRDAQVFNSERDIILHQSGETIKKQTKEWTAKHRQVEDELAETRSRVTGLEIEVNRLTSELDIRDIDQAHVQELEKLTKAMKAELGALKKECCRAEERGKKAQKQKTQTYLDGLTTKVKNLETENAGLQTTIASLKAAMSESADVQLQTALDQKTQAEKELVEVKGRVQRREATIDKLTREMNELKKAGNPTEEIEGLLSEIESITKEFDATVAQNTVLVEHNKKLACDKHKFSEKSSQLSTSKTLLAEELSGLRSKLADAQEVIEKYAALQQAAEASQKATKAELEQVQAQARQMWTEIEQGRHAARRIKNEVEVAKTRLEQEFKARDCPGCQAWEEKEHERVEKLKHARKAGTDPMTAIEKYELTSLRKLVKCSVCLDGQKNVIITKCFHMFCKNCIDSNLKARNRKCPTCKKMYGSDDVKTVWVD